MDISYQIPRPALIWVFAAVILVLLPQSLHTPAWITAIAISCVAWRVLIFTGKLSYPGRAVRILLVFVTLIICATQMEDLGLDLDSAASLLALAFVFKLIEMRHKRDIYVVVCLCFIMCMVAFLYSQSALSTLYLTVVVVIILGAMIALNRSNLIDDSRGTAWMALKILLQALPLTVVLFLLFPRIAPLWAVPVQAQSGTTGVSDEMSPGDISQLVRSADLAFRVQFENVQAPAHAELYWRGLVLDNFDGSTWRSSRATSSYSRAASRADFNWDWGDRVETSGNPLVYNVILEPTQQRWIYGLHLAQENSATLFQSGNFEMFSSRLITQRLSYDLISFPRHQTDLILQPRVLSRSLSLPDGGNPRSRQFAQQLRASVATDREYVDLVLSYFRRNEFFYTLNPPLLGSNRIDDFMFESLEGFCEHYASSFAYLMRAVGIPARVIVGYQGAEYNRFENYLMVYQYNAHAWNEVWLEGEGWVRFDPTGAVSPERVELGVEAALLNDPAFLRDSLFSAIRLGNFNWINNLRLRLDAFEYEWNRRVVNYNEEDQFRLFERFFGAATNQKVLLLLMGLASIVIIGVAFTVIKIEPRSRHDPVNRLYRKLCRELERIKLGRRRGEGPLSYRDRVIAERPELNELMTELTDLYLELSYRQSEANQKQHQLKAMHGVLSRLRLKLIPLLK